VDFNHPLAGRELVFSVHIIAVKAGRDSPLQWKESQRIDAVNLVSDNEKKTIE
jgi:FKBP-type peptidyl-prolyl cis-trans isomerase 2